MRPSEVCGRALDYRTILGQVWDKLGEPLLKTTSDAEVAQAFEAYAPQYAREFVPSLVLRFAIMVTILNPQGTRQWPAM